jgi:pimeloyl-ACP methyl ester carboxylesterase
MIRYQTAEIDGHKLFYREAGDRQAPALLLLHGFPTSSHMFRNLIPLLADRYRIIAPDLPGFGFSETPSGFTYSFDNLAKVIDGFTQAIGLQRYAIFVFDYGAPVGFRLAMAHPERITAIISQNGNAYAEGLSEGWNPIRKYWEEPTEANRAAMRAFLTPETTKWQYVHGVTDETLVAPESYGLDSALLARPGNDEIQLDLFLDSLSRVPSLFPQQAAASPRGLGQERSLLPATRRRGLQARQPERRNPILRHGSFRARNPCRGDRCRHPRIPGQQCHSSCRG